MIDILFYFGAEIVVVRVKGKEMLFGNPPNLAPIKYLRLNKSGVIKEFPDLADCEEWREEAIKRFTEHVSTFN